MKLRFDEAFETGAWPGPLNGCDAIVDEIWVGARGLVESLEVMIGWSHPPASALDRVIPLLSVLRGREGRWTASMAVDPIGTAKRVLQTVDALTAAGWRGEALTPALASLAEATAHLPWGLFDRVREITTAIEGRRLPLATLELTAPLTDHPVMWRRLFQALAAAGTAIEVVSSPPTEATGDLMCARHAPFVPRGDGSLLLIRPHGPMAAAESLAAWWHEQPDPDDLLLVGGDALLDHTLGRFGLPTTGSITDSVDATLTVLPLAMAMALDPIEPEQAYQLLVSPLAPLRRSTRRKLQRALEEWPAVGSPSWETALDEAQLDDPNARTSVAEWFTPTIRRTDGYTRIEAYRRTHLVRAWATRRQMAADLSDGDRAGLARVDHQCRLLLALLATDTSPTLPITDLRAFACAATEAVGSQPAWASAAGTHSVERPEAVCGPAKTIVWWGCHAPRAVPPESHDLVTEVDRTALLAQGIPLPRRVDLAEREARRARRPLMMAEDRLVLVCPAFDEHGAPSHPHPLWDELSARVPAADRSRIASLVRAEFPARALVRQTRARPLPVALDAWTAPGALTLRDQESPSSLTALIGCSFRWALTYVGGVREPTDGPSPLGPLAYGRLAHEVIEKTLASQPSSPAEAAEIAGTIFDEIVFTRVAVLALDGRELERREVRGRYARAAAALVRFMAESGAHVAAIEERHTMDVPLALEGRVDVLLRDPDLVLDLKWQRRDVRISELTHGAAVQLTTYAALAGTDAVAYLIVHSADLLLSGLESAVARTVRGPSPAQVWSGTQAAVAKREGELTRGVLRAPGNASEPDELVARSELADGTVRLAPPCRYCAYAELCGRAYAVAP